MHLQLIFIHDGKKVLRIDGLKTFFFYPYPRTFFHCFLERERKGGEESINAREKHMHLDSALYMPRTGIESAT